MFFQIWVGKKNTNQSFFWGGGREQLLATTCTASCQGWSCGPEIHTNVTSMLSVIFFADVLQRWPWHLSGKVVGFVLLIYWCVSSSFAEATTASSSSSSWTDYLSVLYNAPVSVSKALLLFGVIQLGRCLELVNVCHCINLFPPESAWVHQSAPIISKSNYIK